MGRPPKDKKEKPTGSDWMRAINLGIQFKEQVADSKQWDRWKNYYVGKYNVGQKVVPVNLTFSTGKLMVPKCYFRNPKVKVTPLRPQHHYGAFVVDAVINHLIRELRVKYQIKAAIEDSFATGTSFLKLGFDSEFGYDPDKELEIPTGRNDEKIEYNINVKEGMPWVKWADSQDVVVPWGTSKSGDPEITDIPWIACRFVRMLDDVKDDKRYNKKTVDNLKGEYKPDNDISRGKSGQDVQYVELWEIRDFKRKKLYVVSTEKEEYLLETDDVLQIEGFPILKLIFNTHPKYFWGISDIKQLEPHQLSLNVANTIFNYHIRVALKKFVAQKDTIVNPEALLSDDFAALLFTTGDVNTCLKELNIQIPQDIMSAINQIRMTIRELVGYSRNEAGEFDQSSRRTATEANIVKAGSETRSSERRDVVADLLERTCQKLMQIVFTFWEKNQVIPIIGEDGVQYWVEFSPNDIRGEYQFIVNAEEAQPIDSNSIKEDAVNLLKIIQEDQDFAPEERKKIKLALYSQFMHLGLDPEKALMPRPGMGGSQEQPIPMKEWAAGMEKGKRAQGPAPQGAQVAQQLQQLVGGKK